MLIGAGSMPGPVEKRGRSRAGAAGLDCRSGTIRLL